MEKALSMGAFTELNENEAMKTEGGIWGPAVVLGGALVIGTVIAMVGGYKYVNDPQRIADENLNNSRNGLPADKYTGIYN